MPDDGKIVWYRNESATFVENEPDVLPTSYKMMPVYPNPFNPTTQVTVSLPASSVLQVSVTDILGRQVALLADGQFILGNHSFIFDGEGMSSGIYFIRATVPGQMDQVRKVVLMK